MSPPVRIFALVAALVAVAGALLMFMTGRGAETIAPVALPPAAKVAPAPAAKAKPKVVVTKAAAKAKPAKAKAKATPDAPARAAASAPRPAPKLPEPATGLPVAIDNALASHEVVVVSLVVPGARVDELAADEARAGAQLGGAGYLALNVLNESVAHALLSKLPDLQDPSLLVVTRGGKIATQLNGFVDRDTVAQAAASAAS